MPETTEQNKETQKENRYTATGLADTSTINDLFPPNAEESITENTEYPNEALSFETVYEADIEQMDAAITAEIAELKAATTTLAEAASAAAEPASAKKPRQKKYTMGLASCAASLLVIGVMLIIGLFVPGGVFTVLKLSPIVLIFFGIELLVCLKKKRRVRFQKEGFFLSCMLIAVSAGLAFASVYFTDSGYVRERAEARIAQEVEQVLAQQLATVGNIRSASVSLQLLDETVDRYHTSGDITATDVLDTQIYFLQSQHSLHDFARDARQVLDKLQEIGLPFRHIDIIADDYINKINVSIDGRFSMDISALALAQQATYFAADFEDDIMDLQ